MLFTVYLLRGSAPRSVGIGPGSGIVSPAFESLAFAERIIVDFENVSEEAEEEGLWADRVRIAATRSRAQERTRWRLFVRAAWLEIVGVYDERTGLIELGGGLVSRRESLERVAAWCSVSADGVVGQLQASGFAENPNQHAE